MDYDDGQCAICLFHHVNKVKLRHGHVFYFQCLFNWCMVKLQCPTCRRQFNSFVTSNMPVSAFQNNSFRSTRDYCPMPDIVPQVNNVPIDADSFAMTLFLFNDRAFVEQIVRTQRYDLTQSPSLWIYWLWMNLTPRNFAALPNSWLDEHSNFQHPHPVEEFTFLLLL